MSMYKIWVLTLLSTFVFFIGALLKFFMTLVSCPVKIAIPNTQAVFLNCAPYFYFPIDFIFDQVLFVFLFCFFCFFFWNILSIRFVLDRVDKFFLRKSNFHWIDTNDCLVFRISKVNHEELEVPLRISYLSFPKVFVYPLNLSLYFIFYILYFYIFILLFLYFYILYFYIFIFLFLYFYIFIFLYFYIYILYFIFYNFEFYVLPIKICGFNITQASRLWSWNCNQICWNVLPYFFTNRQKKKI